MCYCSGDPPEREVLQLTLSPCIHATAGLGISDQTVSAHSEMQFGFPLGLETAGRTLPQRRKEAMEECCHRSSGFFFQGRNGTKGNYQQLSA